MSSRKILAALLQLAFLSLTIEGEFTEGYSDVNEGYTNINEGYDNINEGYDNTHEGWDIEEESVTDYIAVNSEQDNPQWTHFFNGSYSVKDIMSELVSNRSLLPNIDR